MSLGGDNSKKVNCFLGTLEVPKATDLGVIIWQCSAKNIPADSLPSRDSAKIMVWSAQQLSFLIENCLMKDVAFCLRLQPLQCFCAWNHQQTYQLTYHHKCTVYQHLCHVNEDDPWRTHYQERYQTPPTNTQRINTYVTSIEKNVN